MKACHATQDMSSRQLYEVLDRISRAINAAALFFRAINAAALLSFLVALFTDVDAGLKVVLIPDALILVGSLLHGRRRGPQSGVDS